MEDPRREAPAVARNRDPILAVLRAILPAEGLVLEVASGSGEHALAIAQAFPRLTIQPSDPHPEARASIDAWGRGQENMRAALDIDAAAPWPAMATQAVLCINMIHISPWAATLGLLRGAAASLPAAGLLYLYGPYRVAGAMVPSNEAFDASLRERDAAWGIRDLEAVTAAAAAEGFGPPEVIEMPANNLSVVFRRSPAS
jgi:SAM-dependent methyltransferase